MLTKEIIKKKALNKYNGYLKSLVSNSEYFPLEIKGNKQFSSLGFSQALKAFEDLYNESKSKKNYGYSFDFKEKKQIKITRIYFETEVDFIKFINKEKDTKTFKSNLSFLRLNLPITDEIILSNLSKISKWDEVYCKNITLITAFLIKNPNSNLYQRELPVHVPTKFLEKNINSITSFLSNFVPLLNVDNKYQKLGLLDKSFIIKIRSKNNFKIYDKSNFCCESDTIYLTPRAFESFSHSAKRIFIVENETSFYNFPIKQDDLCLYSGGFSILSFKNNEYLNKCSIFYFGDVDEHGFAILSMFRNIYPKTKSIFMNMETLNNFKKYLIEGKPYSGIVNNLTSDEALAFDYIKTNNLRLEQEKILISYIKTKILDL